MIPASPIPFHGRPSTRASSCGRVSDIVGAALRGQAPSPTRAFATAAQPDRVASSTAAAIVSAHDEAVALDAWLALAIAALFALERIVATSRPREAEA